MTSEPTQRCPNCHQDKPISAFSHRHNGHGGGPFRRQKDCQECHRLACQDLARLRKIVPPMAANPTCPICDRSGHARFHMDHDHETGEFRAYVCHGCNVNMDRYVGNHPLAAATSRYLELHGSAH